MKLVLADETFDLDFDFPHMRMSDALAIEKVAGRPYAQWESALYAGSAEATAVLACLAWQRDGRGVELKDILEGKADFDFNETWLSVMEAVQQQQQAAARSAETPTQGAVSPTAPDGTDLTPSATKPSSRKSST